MKISARNQLVGKVGKIATGTVNTEVTIKLAQGGEVVAVITKESARVLGLKKRRTGVGGRQGLGHPGGGYVT